MLKISRYLSLFVLMIITTSTLGRILPPNEIYDLSEAKFEGRSHSLVENGKYFWILTNIKMGTTNRRFELRCYTHHRANEMLRIRAHTVSQNLKKCNFGKILDF